MQRREFARRHHGAIFAQVYLQKLFGLLDRHDVERGRHVAICFRRSAALVRIGHIAQLQAPVSRQALEVRDLRHIGEAVAQRIHRAERGVPFVRFASALEHFVPLHTLVDTLTRALEALRRPGLAFRPFLERGISRGQVPLARRAAALRRRAGLFLKLRDIVLRLGREIGHPILGLPGFARLRHGAVDARAARRAARSGVIRRRGFHRVAPESAQHFLVIGLPQRAVVILVLAKALRVPRQSGVARRLGPGRRHDLHDADRAGLGRQHLAALIKMPPAALVALDRLELAVQVRRNARGRRIIGPRRRDGAQRDERVILGLAILDGWLQLGLDRLHVVERHIVPVLGEQPHRPVDIVGREPAGDDGGVHPGNKAFLGIVDAVIGPALLIRERVDLRKPASDVVGVAFRVGIEPHRVLLKAREPRLALLLQLDIELPRRIARNVDHVIAEALVERGFQHVALPLVSGLGDGLLA